MIDIDDTWRETITQFLRLHGMPLLGVVLVIPFTLLLVRLPGLHWPWVLGYFVIFEGLFWIRIWARGRRHWDW